MLRNDDEATGLENCMEEGKPSDEAWPLGLIGAQPTEGLQHALGDTSKCALWHNGLRSSSTGPLN